MPELPEVETIRRGLEKPLTGARIAAAEFTLPRLLLGATAGETARRLAGQRIDAVLRRGKYVVLELERDSLVFHLGMTGQLTHAPADASEDPRFYRTVTGLQKPVGVHPLDKHTHAVFRLDGGGRLQFRDPRTFGKIFWIAGHDWQKHPRLRKLGPEPLEVKIGPFLAAYYPSQSRRPIKALLLDQTFLSGVGNIYADEALFAARIHPLRAARSLDEMERHGLIKAVKTALRKGIANQGTTFSDYRQPDGNLGHHYEHLLAYGRAHEPCRRCRTPLKKIVAAQRGTVFCPACQPRNAGAAGKRHANSARIFSQSRMDKAPGRKHT